MERSNDRRHHVVHELDSNHRPSFWSGILNWTGLKNSTPAAEPEFPRQNTQNQQSKPDTACVVAPTAESNVPRTIPVPQPQNRHLSRHDRNSDTPRLPYLGAIDENSLHALEHSVHDYDARRPPLNSQRQRTLVQGRSQEAHSPNNYDDGSPRRRGKSIPQGYTRTRNDGSGNLSLSHNQQQWSTASSYVSVEEPDDDIQASSDVDLDDIDIQNLASLDVKRKKALVNAIKRFRKTPVTQSSSKRSKLWSDQRPASISESSVSGMTESVSDDESGKYCCNRSKNPNLETQSEIRFCPKCQALFCPRCWIKQVAHKGKEQPGHEKTDPKVAKWVLATLETNLDDDQQAFQHLIDNNSALWFGAGPGDRGVPVFRDFGRYGSLISERKKSLPSRQFPALVSFVGDTGAGKSSLVKLLISMFSHVYQTPVVGSSANEQIPTSGDVHLYSDPQTYHTSDPIFYADAEGLNGGTRAPIAARYRKYDVGDQEEQTSETSHMPPCQEQAHTSSEREILWADTPKKSSREYFVRHLYPRLLYTFSDVVVFVVKNGRTIETVIEQLVTWADAVFEASSNQPVLPHAIIVLNASDNTAPELWDVDTATSDLIAKVEEAMTTNDKLKKYAQKRRSKGANVSNIRNLLLSYYASVHVIPVPTRDQPRLIHDQIQQLYNKIAESAKASLEFKLSVRMKLSSDELQPYLQNAFDHFCRTLKNPFDFVKASHANCNIPSDFSGNILKLALNIMNMERWTRCLDGPLLFNALSFLLASCVMLDAVRRNILGLAEAIFPRYIVHFDEALEDFCDRYWPCEFVCPEGRCVNVRAGHSKGHQLASAKIIEPNAQYVSSFTAANYRQEFLKVVFQCLEELLQRLGTLKKRKTLEEKQAAIELHKKSVLIHFYRQLGGADKFLSHSACLSCLVFVPQHCLPCGHILCTPCIEAFGQRRGQNAIDLQSCPLHDSSGFPSQWTITFQPEGAGVRILALDGGGIRNIIQLMVLQHIEKALEDRLRVQALFDLIVGSGAGAHIALGIGVKNWGLETCMQKFTELAHTVFSRNTRFSFNRVVSKLRDGKHDTAPLETLLRGQFGQENLFGGVQQDFHHHLLPRPKVAITATRTDGTPQVFGNYNRPDKDYSQADVDSHPVYQFVRAERPEQEMKIFEVATAAFAAPKIFKPYEHEATKQSFRDGSIHHNNPIEVAMQEQRLCFSEASSRNPDMYLAIGTGIGVDRAKKITTPGTTSTKGGFLSPYKYLLQIATDNHRQSIESENAWHKFRETLESDIDSHWLGSNTWFRLNFELEEKCPKIDEVSKMQQLKDKVDDMLKARLPEIKEIADHLVATCFYFHPLYKPQKSPSGELLLEGYFECRFPIGSQEIASLGDLLLKKQRQVFNKSRSGKRLAFVFQERHREQDIVEVVIPDDTIGRMRTERRFRMPDQQFIIHDQRAQVSISLRFGELPQQQQQISISGFPRYWDIDNSLTLRSTPSLSKKRDTASSQRRPDWSKPTDRAPEVFDTYAQNDLPGLATQADINKAEGRLTRPADLMPAIQQTYANSDAYTSRPSHPLNFSHEIDTPGQVGASRRRDASELSSEVSNNVTSSMSVYHPPGAGLDANHWTRSDLRNKQNLTGLLGDQMHGGDPSPSSLIQPTFRRQGSTMAELPDFERYELPGSDTQSAPPSPSLDRGNSMSQYDVSLEFASPISPEQDAIEYDSLSIPHIPGYYGDVSPMTFPEQP